MGDLLFLKRISALKVSFVRILLHMLRKSAAVGVVIIGELLILCLIVSILGLGHDRRVLRLIGCSDACTVHKVVGVARCQCWFLHVFLVEFVWFGAATANYENTNQN